MREYFISTEQGGLELIHIMEFADKTHRSVQSLRYLIEQGGQFRKLKSFRDRSRLYIPKTELLGFPFRSRGTKDGTSTIYHYHEDEDGKWKQYVCTECTFGMGCSLRKIADNTIVPEGDK